MSKAMQTIKGAAAAIENLKALAQSVGDIGDQLDAECEGITTAANQASTAVKNIFVSTSGGVTHDDGTPFGAGQAPVIQEQTSVEGGQLG